MLANLTQTLSLLITANHILDYYSIVTGYGHISVRHPLNNATFLMTGNGKPPALVRSPEDFDEFYLEDASPANERSSQPEDTSERYIHQGLLKRFPSLQCVVHSHSRSVITFGISGAPFQPTYHLAGGFIGQSILMPGLYNMYTT